MNDRRRQWSFTERVIRDLHALASMIENQLIEQGIRRIGVEQEAFLVDRNRRPAAAAMDLLAELDDSRFTTELALFNIEMNLDPLVFRDGCLSEIERQLTELVGTARKLARERGVDIVLTGILPTLRKTDLGLHNMTPKPRYRELNRAMNTLRGGEYELYIKGLDELILRHDSVMLEACNASFQVHFQVGAAEFPNLYNIAQVVAGPVLAAATNSPTLFGRQLWQETRIALFQQSVDTRSSMDFGRERSPRVTFGKDWVRGSVLELFQEDISRFKVLMATDVGDDPIEQLERGEIPRLEALCMHNGTVYRWNRACYGVTDGRPHLRIENRVLPSGPTILDQVANAAFWFGLISALSSEYEDITRRIRFDDAKRNFRAAARLGLAAQYVWLNGATMPAKKLICDHLLPLAREGLIRRTIDPRDADRYLSVIDERVRSGRTGAHWITASLDSMADSMNKAERLNTVTAAMIDRQTTCQPVSRWTLAQPAEKAESTDCGMRVEQYMTTDLFTVCEDDSLDLVASMMEWKRIRHVPVEDQHHRLIGLISYRSLLSLIARWISLRKFEQVRVSDLMKRDPVTIAPGASTLEAIELMRAHGISCLPVVSREQLVGIISERDLMNLTADLLLRQLRE